MSIEDSSIKDVESRIAEIEAKIVHVQHRAQLIIFGSAAVIGLGIFLAFLAALWPVHIHFNTLGRIDILLCGIALEMIGICALGSGLLFRKARTASLRQALELLNMKRRFMK